MNAREALLEAADDILRELICCDVYERDKYTDRAGNEHAICFWSGAARAIVLAHADRLEDGGTMELPEGLCGRWEDHEPHRYGSKSQGMFWCHADQSKRPPFISRERKRKWCESCRDGKHDESCLVSGCECSCVGPAPKGEVSV